MESLARAANRGSISTGPYEIANSCRFDNAHNSGTVADYMVRETGTPSDQTRWTLSCWVKYTAARVGNRGGASTGEYTNIAGANTEVNVSSAIRFSTGDESATASHQLSWKENAGEGGGGHELITTRAFRDDTAWYHLVFVFNSNESTQADRAKIYVNGVRETEFATNSVSIGSAEDSPYWNDASFEHFVGRNADGEGMQGYIAEMYFLDGQAKAASDFGENHEDTGTWIPKKYSGSFGNNGYHLDFENSGSMGTDASGNGNNFTVTGIAAINQCTDSPTNNFCTLKCDGNQSGLLIYYPGYGGTQIGVNENKGLPGTMAVNKGKWYWEVLAKEWASTPRYWKMGVATTDYQQTGDTLGDSISGWYIGTDSQTTFHEQTSRSASNNTYNTGLSALDEGTIMSVSLNCDVDPYVMTLRFDNSVPGTTANNTDRSVGSWTEKKYVFPVFRAAQQSNYTWANFGNPAHTDLNGGNADENGYGNFKYAPPSGYYALCSKNLAEYA